MITAIQFVEDPSRPEVQAYRSLRRLTEHREQELFVAEGAKLLDRLLESDLEIVSVLCSAAWLDRLRPRLEARRESIAVYQAEKSLIEAVIGHTCYQPVRAIARVPAPVALEQGLSRLPKPWLLAAVEGLNNAENVGVLVRNCAAFGVQALLVGETASSPWVTRSVRVSMGTVFDLPIFEVPKLSDTLKWLQSQMVRCVAAHPHPPSIPLSQAPLEVDCCIVLGNEGDGLTPGLVEACDERVAIPMHGGVDSLNVAVCSAVFFYEARRQRGQG